MPAIQNTDTPALDGLTVMRCGMSNVATKTWRRVPGADGWLKSDYKAGTYFQAAEPGFSDLRGLAEVIETVRADPRCLIVRGALAEDLRQVFAEGRTWLKRSKNVDKKGNLPTLVEVPRRWVMIDIDKWRMPTWADLADEPDLLIDHAIYELLPECFHDAEAYWHLSSSAGFAGNTVSIHLFFWLSEPASNLQIKAALRPHYKAMQQEHGRKILDGSVFVANQPHYIADPVIEGGHDPLPRRSGWRRGTEASVILPVPEATPAGERQASGDPSDTARLSNGVGGALARLGDGEDRDGFNAPLLVAGMRYARECVRYGGRDDAAFLAFVRDAIANAPRGPGRGPADIDRYLSDGYLLPSIEGAFTKVAVTAPATRAPVTVAAPANAPQRVSVDEARLILADGARLFREAVEEHADAQRPSDPPGNLIGILGPEFWAQMAPVYAIRVDVGAGKSAICARGLAADMLADMRARGDMRTGAVLIPTHTLGDEQAAAFELLPQAAGLTAAVWRSRAAKVPGARDDNDTMCLDLDAVQDAIKAHADVQTAVCRRGDGDDVHLCEHFEVCPFQNQNRKADLWFLAHEMAFRKKAAVIGDLAFVIVDESAWQDGLDGADEAKKLTVHSLAKKDEVPGSEADTLTLRNSRVQALAVLEGAPIGPVTLGAFAGNNLTASDCRHAENLEWSRKMDHKIIPGMAPMSRKDEVLRVAENRRISRLAMFWRAMAALLREDDPAFKSGWLALTEEDGGNGPVPTLAIKGRQDVHKDWRVPTLHLDANLNLDLLRWHWPTVQQIADVAVSAPHQRVDQVTDSPYAPDRFVGKDPSSFRNLRGLHALVCTFARDYAPRTLLLVAQKDVEKALKRLGLPANVDTAHHNDIAGKDLWGPQPGKPGAAALVVIGRTAPKPSDVERIAEALTGRAVEPLPYWYAKAQTAREMADGTWIAAEADRHPDPIAEAVRWTICEGEVVQIVGRPRGVNRTAADPVDVLVMTDTVLPVQLADTLAASDLAPTPVDLMLAAGGIAYANPAHAAEAYHGVLWDNREAAKKAMERAVGDKLLKGDPLLKRSVPNCLTVTYQKAGARQRPATATVDLIRHADPAAALTAALGPLAWCKPEVQPEEVTMPAATAEPAIRLISVTREPTPARPEVSLRPDLMLLIGGNSAQRLKSLSARLEAAKPIDSREAIDKPCTCGGVVFWTPGTRWLCAACQPPIDGAEPKAWTVLPKAKRPEAGVA